MSLILSSRAKNIDLVDAMTNQRVDEDNICQAHIAVNVFAHLLSLLLPSKDTVST